jgi:hypothetical protein
MNIEKKETYVRPELVKHELLRDITAQSSGNNDCNGLEKQRCEN